MKKIIIVHTKSEMIAKYSDAPIRGKSSQFTEKMWLAMARVMFPKMPPQAADTALLTKMSHGKRVKNERKKNGNPNL